MSDMTPPHPHDRHYTNQFLGASRDLNVDRALGELWLISDIVTADLRTDFSAARREVAEWEPQPMPKGWHPSQGKVR